MTDYNQEFDKLVKDLRRQMDLELLLKESLEEQRGFHNTMMQRLNKFLDQLEAERKQPTDPILSNDDFINLMNIKPNTAIRWRQKGIINYIHIQGMIYYVMSDIQSMLKNNYNELKEKPERTW